MNEVEYIPVETSKTAALALIAERQSYTPERMRDMPMPALRHVQRGLYLRAQSTPLLRTLKQAVRACGTHDPQSAAHVWRINTADGATIEAALDSYAGLTVKLNEVTVCDDRQKLGARVIFVPDAAWMIALLEAYEDAQFVAAHTRELAEESERLALVGALTK